MVRRPLTVAVIAASAAVTGCQADSPSVSSAPTSVERSTPDSPSAPKTATSSTTSAPPEPTFPELPARTQDAGTVRDGKPVEITGEGDRAVAYEAGGDFGVAVDLDCTKCSGPVELTEADRRGDPWLDAKGPARTTILVGIHRADQDGQIIVRASGRWTLTFYSWNDPPFRGGAQSGKGGALVKVAGPGRRIRLHAKPAGADDPTLFRVRQAGKNQNMRVIGDSKPMTETIEMPLPAVVVVQGQGSWKIEPVT